MVVLSKHCRCQKQGVGPNTDNKINHRFGDDTPWQSRGLLIDVARITLRVCTILHCTRPEWTRESDRTRQREADLKARCEHDSLV